MSLRRALAVVVAGALLALEAAAPVQAAEPGHPTGTFTLDRTFAYLHYIDWEPTNSYGETFKIRGSGLTDDETAAEDLVVEASPGDGRGFHPISVPCPAEPAFDECSVHYDEAGTFTPQVRLTDEDGNSTTIDLPEVRLLRDETAPVVRVTKPPRRRLHRVSAWRVIRGTVYDEGVGGHFREGEPDGINSVSIKLLQKRGARWWYYGYVSNPRPGAGHYRWFRGLRTEAATFDRIHHQQVAGIEDRVDGTRWQTPRIRGLKRGPLVVRVNAYDWNANETAYRKYVWVRLNRR